MTDVQASLTFAVKQDTKPYFNSSALTGGFLLGWGVMVLLLRQWVFDAAPDAVRKAVLGGLIAWFLLDSTGSYASGNASNVIFNVLVLATLSGPLWIRARDIG